jgi:hypothetical protein
MNSGITTPVGDYRPDKNLARIARVCSVVLDLDIQGFDDGIVVFQFKTRLGRDDSVFGGKR